VVGEVVAAEEAEVVAVEEAVVEVVVAGTGDSRPSHR
jgi:hypothetical protein